jgi:CheY-like chemotaxis protein/AraC-like DNA-binding protein
MPNLSWNDPEPPRILIVDDNPTVHDAFDEILRRVPANAELEKEEAFMFGAPQQPRAVKPTYQTDHALSGAEGIEKVRQAIQADAPYQVAFVDVRMPGMDGVEAVERMWELDPHIQTVICTAYADYRWEDLAKRLGQTDRLLVLKKPFHDIEVMQLASALARKWILGRQAAMKFEQAETLVAHRTQKLIEFHRREHQRIEELDQTKLRHLTTLAQEFRGPLTVMLQALENAPGDAAFEKSAREALHRNARALQQMVEESLLVRRLELEDRRLDWNQTELVAFARGLVQMFAAGARERGIEIEFQAEPDSHLVWTDTVKLEKALFNIFAHALAASADRSRLFIRLGFNAAGALISIEIPRPAREDPAIQEHDLGLLLSREILALLGGGLKIETSGAHAANTPTALRILAAFPETRTEAAPAVEAGTSTDHAPELDVASERDLPVILLIEENPDLRTFIREGFGRDYSVVATSASAQGMAAAREHVPDLILIGMDAPKSDGVNLCTLLKRDEITSHIPVVLLATDDSEASQMRALEAGVDDFLTMPFRLPLLKARVDNLLENRRKLHEHFQQLQTVLPRELATNQMDAEFLQRVVEIVEKNLADYEFDMEKLARLMAVSRRQLFRKFKALAGSTPNVFIRDIRLKRAAQLLRESHLTVSEIMYSVGFSDPKYFRNIFRERFGVLPGEYLKVPKAQELSGVNPEDI